MNALSVAHTLRLSSLEGVDVYFNTDRTIVETNLLPTAGNKCRHDAGFV